MESLRKMSLAAVIKFGIGPRADLPSDLPVELEAKEEFIQDNMTGNFVEHGNFWGDVSLDISWERKFEVNTGREWSEWIIATDFPYRQAIIRAGRRNHLNPNMSSVFLLEPLDSLSVDNFYIDEENKIVAFHGSYTVNNIVAKFTTQFRFALTFSYMEIETEVEKDDLIFSVSADYLHVVPN